MHPRVLLRLELAGVYQLLRLKTLYHKGARDKDILL